MAKYLIDPIYAYKEIKDNFILYVKTAFGTRYKSIEEEREELLRTDQVAAREPWIEPLPAYKNVELDNGEKLRISSLRKQDLPTMNQESSSIFKEFILKGLIKGDYPIYQHQAEMLRKALEGKNCVITSGTGSGKTESFLLLCLRTLFKKRRMNGNSLLHILQTDGGMRMMAIRCLCRIYLNSRKEQNKELPDI